MKLIEVINKNLKLDNKTGYKTKEIKINFLGMEDDIFEDRGDFAETLDEEILFDKINENFHKVNEEFILKFKEQFTDEDILNMEVADSTTYGVFDEDDGNFNVGFEDEEPQFGIYGGKDKSGIALSIYTTDLADFVKFLKKLGVNLDF